MKKNQKGTVLINEKISENVCKMVINSEIPDILAGQFISILIPNKTLRRPFSVADFYEGKITVLYKLKGDGTHYLSSLEVGSKIDFLAPLGNSFSYEGVKSALLVGAGVGIAPMLFLKRRLCEQNIENYLISGFKTEDEVIKGSDKNVIGGSVLDNIDDVIDDIKPDIIYSCAPLVVLKILSENALKRGLNIQIAMEKVMACGIGVCRGCVIKLKNGENKSVCKDGAVFNGKDIQW